MTSDFIIERFVLGRGWEPVRARGLSQAVRFLTVEMAITHARRRVTGGRIRVRDIATNKTWLVRR